MSRITPPGASACSPIDPSPGGGGDLTFGEFIDLTDDITAACAVPLDNDPQGEFPSLFVTSVTATFNNEVVPCNNISWQASGALTDGYSEGMYTKVGDILTYIPDYDLASPQVGWQLVCDVVDVGNAPTFDPMVAMMVSPDQVVTGSLPSCGVEFSSATQLLMIHLMSENSGTVTGVVNPGNAVAQFTMTTMPVLYEPGDSTVMRVYQNIDTGLCNYSATDVDPGTNAALHIFLGTDQTGSGPIIDLKLRFRIRAVYGGVSLYQQEIV